MITVVIFGYYSSQRVELLHMKQIVLFSDWQISLECIALHNMVLIYLQLNIIFLEVAAGLDLHEPDTLQANTKEHFYFGILQT